MANLEIDRLSDGDNPVFGIEIFENSDLDLENLVLEADSFWELEADSFWEGDSKIIKSVLVYDLDAGPIYVYSKGSEGPSPPSWVQKDFGLCCKYFDASRRRGPSEQ